MLALLCLGLAWGCAVAWRGPRRWPEADPIGDWDEVLESLAIRDWESADREARRWARRASKLRARAKHTHVSWERHLAYVADREVCQVMAALWRSLRDGLPRARPMLVEWADGWGLS